MAWEPDLMTIRLAMVLVGIASLPAMWLLWRLTPGVKGPSFWFWSKVIASVTYLAPPADSTPFPAVAFATYNCALHAAVLLILVGLLQFRGGGRIPLRPGWIAAGIAADFALQLASWQSQPVRILFIDTVSIGLLLSCIVVLVRRTRPGRERVVNGMTALFFLVMLAVFALRAGMVAAMPSNTGEWLLQIRPWLFVAGALWSFGWTFGVVLMTVMSLNAELEAESARVSALASVKSDFLANMSHEIRTPLNAIIGLAQVMERGRLDDDGRKIVGQILLSGRLLSGVVDDILTFSKIEAGHLELERVPFDLDEISGALAAIMTANATGKDVETRIDIDPAVPRLLTGDPLRLQQVLINLVGNALKFTGHGSVVVRISSDAQSAGQVKLRISVRDTGIGMTAAQVDGLFQPFTQADASTTRRYGGTGLGLAISKRLTDLMGGTIGVRSVPGEGSEFWIAVPLGVSDAAPSRSSIIARDRGMAHPDAEAAGLRLRDLRILVVEDNPINQQVAKRVLALEGASVTLADDGGAGLALLRAGRADYDLVLMDAQMPEMDGFEATRRIRDELGLSTLPVIALTAGVMEADRQRCLDAGMTDFVAKPLDIEELVDCINRHVATRGTGRGADSRHGPGNDAAPPTDQARPGAIAGVDLAVALSRVAGDWRLLLGLLDQLAPRLSSFAAEVEDQLSHGRLDDAKRHLHWLRGGAAQLGATRLADVAGRLERAMMSDRVQEWPAMLADLGAAAGELAAGIVDANRHAGPANAPAADPECDGVAEFGAMLAAENIAAADRLSEVGPQLAAMMPREEFARLTAAVADLELASAARILEAYRPSPGGPG